MTGNLLRPPVTSGGRGGLALPSACLLLALAYLVTRMVTVPRAALAPPGPGGFVTDSDRPAGGSFRGRRGGYRAEMPPSTGMIAPVT